MSAIVLTLNPHNRLELSTTIERLINMLDDISPDPDLEGTGDDEPWLGWTDRGPSALAKDAAHDDREGEHDDREGGDINDEPQPNGDEGDYSDADCDAGLLIWGGNEEMPRNHPRP